MALTPIDQLQLAGSACLSAWISMFLLIKTEQSRMIPAFARRCHDSSRAHAGGESPLASHLGRPKGKVDPTYSLKPAADRLRTLLGDFSVSLATDCIGAAVQTQSTALPAGVVLILENLRFHAEEEKNELKFAQALAALADVYINDAFGSSHRAHASVVGIVPHVATTGIGFLMRKEIDALSRLLTTPSVRLWRFWAARKCRIRSGLFTVYSPEPIPSLLVGQWRTRCNKRKGSLRANPSLSWTA